MLGEGSSGSRYFKMTTTVDTMTDTEKLTPRTSLVMIVGHFGSGKTEIAVNLALTLKRQGRGITIADLDVVNPYFRCRESQELMQREGIRVVAPPGAQRYADLPIVMPEILGMVRQPEKKNHFFIFDVGGDDVGATLLSSLAEPLGNKPYSLLQVINSRRPVTGTLGGCLAMKEAIERASRLRVTGFIVNSHLGDETTVDVIEEGVSLGSALFRETGIPLQLVTVMGSLAESPAVLAIEAPVMRLERAMVPPWLPASRPSECPTPDSVPPGPRI